MLKLQASYFINELVSKDVYMSAVLSDDTSGMRQEVFATESYPNKTADKTIAAKVAAWAASTTGFNEGIMVLSSDPSTKLESIYGYPNIKIESEDTALSESFKALHPVIRQALAG